MRIFLPLSICLALITVSCTDCNCNYKNFERIKDDQTKKQVIQILKTEPSKVRDEGGYEALTYECDGNYIEIMYWSDRVVAKSFNAKVEY